MLPDPYTMLEIARLKQADFLEEVRRERLANAIRTPLVPSLYTRSVAEALAVSRRMWRRPTSTAPASAVRSRRPALPNASA